VKALDGMIKDIKQEGFDKSKQAITEKNNIIKTLEMKIKTMQNTLKMNNEIKKKAGANSTKLLDEKDRLAITGFVN
jgi:hypothetical protein